MTTPATEPTIAELYRAKGPKWRAREMVVELRAVADGATQDGASDDGAIPVRLSSENPVERYDWDTDTTYTEILDHSKVDLSYARDGLPFCVDHFTTRQVGLIDNVRVEGGEIVGEVLQGNHPDAEWVFADIRDGIRKKVSIGYLQGDYTSEKRKGDAPEVRRYGFMPIEGSTVCIPADYEVGFDGRSQLRALRPSLPLSPEQPHKGTENTMPETASDAPDTGADNEEQRQEQSAAEKLRIRKLRGLRDQFGVNPDAVLGWIDEGTSYRDALEQARDAKDEGYRTDETRTIGTGSAPEIFVKSGKGPMGRDGKVKDGESGGFDSVGHFLSAVRHAAVGRGLDPRLTNRAAGSPTGQSEGLASDGGFLLPPQFLQEITDPIYQTGAILSRVRRMPISGNTLNIAVIDETSRANGSRFGAVAANWADEAGTADTVGKIKVRNHLFNTKKIIAKGYATEEQLEDIPNLTAELPVAFREELQFLCEDAVINGTGNGQPAGIIPHAAVVQVAIEAGQTIANTAQSIVLNTSKMYVRVPPKLLPGCVWLMNIDLMPKLIAATLGGTSAAMPVYMPPGGLSGSPYGSILGLPVVFTEYSLAEGTPGDIMLVNLSQYRLVEKASGINMQTSAHVNFLAGETAFRFVYRVDGAPMWKSAITPYKGSNTKSFAVTLAARS